MSRKTVVWALVGAAVFGGVFLFIQCGGDGWTDSRYMRFFLALSTILGALFGPRVASELRD